MDIELFAGDTKAIISTKGVWLTNLSDGKGDILYPKRLLRAADGSQKYRGGSHVCLPNFGPGGDSGLEQHGYGRTIDWQVTEQTEAAVELSCRGIGAYADMQALLRYELGEQRLSTKLTLRNLGDKQLRVAPAFHPYFFTGTDPVVLDGDTLHDLSHLAETEFVEGDTRRLTVNGRDLLLTADGLPIWAVWTDQLGAYVCVEPTAAGNAFLESAQADQWLHSGETRSYSLTISWVEK